MIDQLLQDNGLLRKQIPIGSQSLFRAISDALYFTTSQHAQISQMLVQYLEKQMALNLIPQSLSILKTNQALRNDYCKQPSFSSFDQINLQLTSMMFRVKINLYYIQDNRLMCRIYNDHHLRMIELCRDDNNHYDSVYSKEFIQNATLVQQIIYEQINNIIGLKVDVPKKFKNIEQDIWMNEKVFSDVRSTKKIRSNSEHKKDQQDLLLSELENIQKKQHEEDSTEVQISNLKSNPPGLDNSSIRPNQSTTTPSNKPVVLEVPTTRETGKLKFFDEQKSYGFIVLDSDNSDVFVHLDDLQRAGITKEDLRKLGSCFRSQTQVNHYGRGNEKPPSFSFQLMTYVGKYNKSRKAVDLKLINE
ncbi:unnamed protein product [Paramecium octaurelia]|uniref:CSD domain-containing protein n=1 Tax=Paramecium octaurelia TaxID=43137 RepID=A0A8S1VNY5_PAROT|nr:unnamed protein product [Paramecium octaurelia]